MEPVGSLSPLASRVYLLGFGLGLFVSRRGNDLCHGTAGRAKLDRNHSRITDDFAAEFFQIGGGFGHIVHFNGEVMDARSQSGSAGASADSSLSYLIKARSIVPSVRWREV